MSLMLAAMAIYVCSCSTGGTSIEIKNDPIKPLPELKEGTVDPVNNAITISKDGITVIAEHWSRARLDRKYTTADMRSPFFYLETWDPSKQSEVFHVTIKNETPKWVVLDEDNTKLYDDRKYQYNITPLETLRYKFVAKQYMDLKTKNGLEIAPQILLLEKLGPKKLISANTTVDGFLPYYTPSTIAEKVWLIVTLEKEPVSQTAVAEKVNFRFDYSQDLTLRKTQPPTKR